jgi:hypothetical protein
MFCNVADLYDATSGPNFKGKNQGGHPGAATKQKQNPYILLRHYLL